MDTSNPKLQVKNVLVTGVSGLIGNLVYVHLSRQTEAYEVYGLDRSPTNSERIESHHAVRVPAAKFFEVELTDLYGLREAVAGKQAVVHLAADPGSRNWETLLPSNVIGAYNIFEACRLENVQRIIFASTVVVDFGYGVDEPYSAIMQGDFANVPNDYHKITHDQPPRPSTLYSATKLWGEALAYHFMHEYGISCLCLRIGWVVDENVPPPKHGRSVWCSHRDVCQLVQKSLDAPADLRFDIFYGFSDNDYILASLDHTRNVLGYQPQDSAEEALGLINKIPIIQEEKK